MSQAKSQSSPPQAMPSYTVAIAGTTQRTLICAQTVATASRLSIPFVITPAPKPMGREQKLSSNPVLAWANSNHAPTVLVKNKIDEQVKKSVTAFEKPDFLLVVDFGYLVPKWLLKFPKIMPLNIHPSALPCWRGSSPGQAVLLTGEATSAVSVIQMTGELDQGPIVWQQGFAVQPHWTQAEYYQHSFKLASQALAQLISQLAAGEVQPHPQPQKSPTPLATQITKEMAFVRWAKVQTALSGKNFSLAKKLERASRAYSPWPYLWTKIPTNKGPRRMQILSAQLAGKKLVLNQVKIAGMTTKPWHEVKNVVREK